jgi:mRNA interferase MazF
MAEEYRFGEIVLVDYPFSDGIREKLRPSLVVSSQADGDILLARITSKPSKTPNDIPLTDWKESHLMLASAVRLEKLTSLLATRVEGKIGKLSARDRKRVIAGLRAFVDSLD